jgi:Protein of unknown function (DUF2934)
MPASADHNPGPPSAIRSTDLQQAITRRAGEIYERSGRVPGRDVQNWIQAEAEIQREFAQGSRRAAVKVRVDGVEYIGEYNRALGGYVPGEFAPEDPVPVRFDGNKMYVKRPNGKELETKIVKKVG